MLAPDTTDPLCRLSRERALRFAILMDAIRCLAEAFDRGFQNKGWFENDPDLDPLRGDPRFQSLIDRI